ncbi:MAG: helix-turn-helix domain-containing protein [Longimicrobiales bacterium]
MARRPKSIGQRLLQSAREAARIERGEIEPARVTRYTVAEAEVTPPPHYRAGQIREIRDQMEFSQPVFAAALNVSADTIRAWEQGKRKPDGPTLRLLEVAEQHPEVFLNKLRKRTRDGGPARLRTRAVSEPLV